MRRLARDKSRAIGRVSVNTEPLPSTLCASIFPLEQVGEALYDCESETRSAIGAFHGPIGLVKLLKIRRICGRAMPTPLSSTAMET